MEEENRKAELLRQDMLLVAPLLELTDSFAQHREVRLQKRAEAEKANAK